MQEATGDACLRKIGRNLRWVSFVSGIIFLGQFLPFATFENFEYFNLSHWLPPEASAVLVGFVTSMLLYCIAEILLVVSVQTANNTLLFAVLLSFIIGVFVELFNILGFVMLFGVGAYLLYAEVALLEVAPGSPTLNGAASNNMGQLAHDQTVSIQQINPGIKMLFAASAILLVILVTVSLVFGNYYKDNLYFGVNPFL
jgi:hypothetical protein